MSNAIREHQPSVSETGPNGETIAVYTQGKVGSTSIRMALEQMYPGVHIWSAHRGSLEGIREQEAMRGMREGGVSKNRMFADFVHSHPESPLKLTSIVREPVAVAVSSLFFNFGRRNPGQRIQDEGDSEIIARLVEGQSFSTPTFHLDWFGIEAEPFTGIDVYETPFSAEKGYETYKSQARGRIAELLVMRLEDINRVASAAIGGYFNQPLTDGGLPRANSAEELDYAERYKQFKDSAQLPEVWVNWQLDSQYAQHFYTDDERMGFAERWIKGA